MTLEARSAQLASMDALGVEVDETAATVVALAPSTRTGASGGRGLDVVDRLRNLRLALQATSVSVARVHRDEACFELVAATGAPLLAPGARLPLSASSVVLAASMGRRAMVSIEATSRPLDHLAATLGARSALGIPLSAFGSVVGALAILWSTPQPSIANPHALVIGDENDFTEAVLNRKRVVSPKVLICHEDSLTANGLARVAEYELGATVAVAETVDAALAAIARERPDLIACSNHLPPGLPLGDLARRIRAAGAAAPLMVLARTDSCQTLKDTLAAGASAYLTRARAAVDLTSTATELLAGNSVLPTPDSTPPEPHLTKRERDVLFCFERGLSDKEIASALGVAISTVKTHARAIYAKLGVPSRTAALHKARVDGVL